MKLKKVASWSIGIALAITCTAVPFITRDKQNKQPQKKTEVRPNIRTRIDTINVTDEQFEKFKCKYAAGEFKAHNNTIVIYYFNPQSSNPKIHRYCNNNNNLIPLTIRHETEHARKASLTKNVSKFDSFTRGRIAAMNEIMAPAAEIIEAIDYRHENHRAFPTPKSIIKNADKQIVNTTNDSLRYAPADFNQEHIADIVLENALQRFLSETARGTYIGTIRREMNNRSAKKYTPNNQCTKLQEALFLPNSGMWAPMWEFESKNGPVNLWIAASTKQRQRILNSVDSTISKIAGKNTHFLKNWNSR